jgi:lipopolysaccharide transport system ATP-binding protein
MPVIRVENLSKSYRLGQIGSSTLRDDLSRAWAKLRKQPDPLLRIGQEDQANRQGESIWALKDVSFEVEQGEVLGIIGRNGAGKSTLLKILSRVTAPTSGVVRVKGRIASLLEVGTGFHPELTGRENIYLNGAILGMSREEVRRKFDEIVDFSGVEKFIDTPVKRYSSGMYVRLAFAVAAHLEPEILLVDEVLAVGDAEFQKKCLGKIGEISNKGRTILFVSHNLTAIKSLCRRCILLINGIVRSDNHCDQVVDDYLSGTSTVDNSGEILWNDLNAPGTNYVKCLHVKFSNSRGETTTTYDYSEPINIEIAYVVLKAMKGFMLQTSFYSNFGAEIFHSTDYHLRNGTLLPGKYKSTCTIPANLLNNGIYTIKVSGGVPRERAHFGPMDVTTLHLSGAPLGPFSETWTGIISPKVQWIIDQIIT